MKIDIKHIAKLSRLKIEDSRLEKFEKDMEMIVNMVDNMPDIDGPLTLLDEENPMTLREDIAVTNKSNARNYCQMRRRFRQAVL